MKKYIGLVLLINAAVFATSIAADERVEQLNTQIQNDLNANIIFDRTLAERLLIIDIEDELISNNKGSNIKETFLKSEKFSNLKSIAANTKIVAVKTAE
jgi:hypothetical protein